MRATEAAFGGRDEDHKVPGRIDALLFRLKAAAFQFRRSLINLAAGPARLTRADAAPFAVRIAISETNLWQHLPDGEAALQRGKVENLRLAARRLDRTLIPAGGTFSFWKQLGRASRPKGFVPGRMLQEGCLVPAVGGGLCQLSNALYDVALQAGCEIVERHAHSRIVPGSSAEHGRDATVAWNYVDLRFRTCLPVLLRVRLDARHLRVALFSTGALPSRMSSPWAPLPRESAQSCASCGTTSCFRHEAKSAVAERKTAYLVDEVWPELNSYIDGVRKDGDVLCLPIDGKRWRLPQYGWSTAEFERIHCAPLTTLRRGLRMRALASQGAERQAALLRAHDALAERYARHLTPDVTDVVVALPLLAPLWRRAALGGRRVRVLMTRLPLDVLHARLDEAARLHPDFPTLTDFRAPEEWVLDEMEALAGADRLIAPHTEIARLFPGRVISLDWNRPRIATTGHAGKTGRIAFPGPTVARKGASELRDAARALNFEVLLLGSDLEGEEFWRGVRVLRPRSPGWIAEVDALVQPAFVEDKPRRALAALAAGLPVIATPACGMPAQPGLTLVAAGDVSALIKAVKVLL